MSKQVKILIAIWGFALLLFVTYIAYNNLSDKYSANDITANTNSTSQNQPEVRGAPDFSMLDENGNSVKLSDYFGKPIVMNFWASWCDPCKGEMPEFDSAYNENKDEIQFIMVNLTDGQRETIETAKKFISDSGYTFPIFFDTEQDGVYNYGITSIPCTLFINRDGDIVKGYQGVINGNVLRSEIERIR